MSWQKIRRFSNMHKDNFFVWLFHEIRRIIYIAMDEYRLVFKDSGLIVVFIGATLIYPPLYSSIYRNETVRDMPIAVVDESMNSLSRDLVRSLNATPELKVEYQQNNLEECKDLFYRNKIHGMVLIPKDFSQKILRKEQANVSMYSDMSSFLYYRAMMMGTNMTVLEFGKDVKMQRLNAMGITGKSAEIAADPLGHEGTILFNESMGFFSFLIPVLLILMLHQTLFFGITMVNGTLRDEGMLHSHFEVHQRGKFFQTLLGRALCYFSFYIVIAAYILLFIPKAFQLPHLGDPINIMMFAVPLILAVIFFAMTCSVFIRNRETGLVLFLFFSLILLFLSGFSWPESNIHWFWRSFAMLFPSTFGIQGFLKINSMGADLSQVKYEVVGLWIQVVVYFITTMIVFRIQHKISDEEI